MIQRDEIDIHRESTDHAFEAVATVLSRGAKFSEEEDDQTVNRVPLFRHVSYLIHFLHHTEQHHGANNALSIRDHEDQLQHFQTYHSTFLFDNNLILLLRLDHCYAEQAQKEC